MLGTGDCPRDDPASRSSSKSTSVHSAQALASDLLSDEVEIAKANARETKVSQEHALKLLNPLSGGAVDSAPRPSSAPVSGFTTRQEPRAEAAAPGGGAARTCNVLPSPGTPVDRVDASHFEHVLQTVLAFAGNSPNPRVHCTTADRNIVATLHERNVGPLQIAQELREHARNEKDAMGYLWQLKHGETFQFARDELLRPPLSSAAGGGLVPDPTVGTTTAELSFELDNLSNTSTPSSTPFVDQYGQWTGSSSVASNYRPFLVTTAIRCQSPALNTARALGRDDNPAVRQQVRQQLQQEVEQLARLSDIAPRGASAPKPPGSSAPNTARLLDNAEAANTLECSPLETGLRLLAYSFFYDYRQFPILHPFCYSRFAISNRLAQSAHLSQHRGVTSGSKEVTGTAPSPP